LTGHSSGTVQYRIVVAKKAPELVAGPDDADLVITVPLADALTDPTVSYMQGKLKPVGHAGLLFEVLKSGEVARRLRELAPTSDPA